MAPDAALSAASAAPLATAPEGRLIDLRARRETLALEQECAQLQAETSRINMGRSMAEVALHETVGGMAYNYVDPMLWRTDQFGQAIGSGYTAGGHNARDEGRDRPVIETELDVTEIRGIARFLVDTNGFAIGALERLCDYTISTGFTYSAAPKGKSAEAKLVAGFAQAVIDEFIEATDFVGKREREAFKRSVRDGETFIRTHDVGGGRAAIRIIEPEYVTESGGEASLDDWVESMYPGYIDPHETNCWTFGIHTPQHDVEHIYGYHVAWNAASTDEEYVLAADMEHMKRNTDGSIKRGISDFFPTRKDFDGADALLGSTVKGASVQAKIAFIRQWVAGTTKDGVNALQAQKADYQWTQTTQSGNTRTNTVHRYNDGTILDVPKGQEYLPGPLGAERGPIFLEIVQGALRGAAARWGMPEHMISVDASNNNLASILEAGSPFVKHIQWEQGECIRSFVKIIWRVLKIAVDAGRFQKFGIESLTELRQLLHVQAVAPDVSTRDRDKETQRNKILHDDGIMSPATWAAKEDLDYEEEKAKQAAVKPSRITDTETGLIDKVPVAGSSVGTGSADAQTKKPLAHESPSAPGTEDPGTAAAAPKKAEAVQRLQTSSDQVLNGAQVTAATAIVTAVAQGVIPRDAGIGQLEVLFNLAPAQAERLMGSAGTSKPNTPNPVPETPAASSHAAPAAQSAGAAESQAPVSSAKVARKFSSTQFNLPEPVASKVVALAASISDEDLRDHGREGEPHVTVKYGLHTNDAAEVASLVSGFGPVMVAIGQASVFSTPKYDVVKFDINGPRLLALNRLVSTLDHTDTHPTYQPHATVAYVAPGEGQKWADRFNAASADLAGSSCELTDLIFSPVEGPKAVISLTATPQSIAQASESLSPARAPKPWDAWSSSAGRFWP